MLQQKIDGRDFSRAIQQGANNLRKHAKLVDQLNVFPVPDGDTGTNMNLSFTSGVEEMLKTDTGHIGNVAKALSKGLLMGARGNSGVILSQLFRGFSKHIENEREIDARQFARALQSGVDTAYKAVMKPVEGTILTVAKDAAQQAKKKAQQTRDVVEVMEVVLTEARASLERTPELLAVLKQVGVVDSGGQGLVYVYEGFLSALKNEPIAPDNDRVERTSVVMDPGNESVSKDDHVQSEVQEMMAAGILSVDDIQYGYCTEFMIRLHPEKQSAFDEPIFREQIDRYGDSLLVISDEELVKVHIHAEELDKVMALAQGYGELSRIKIENMREQFLKVKGGGSEKADPDGLQTASANEVSVAQPIEGIFHQVGQAERDEHGETKPIGIVIVAMGEGIADIFRSLGADVVIAGGQTMNPSTSDFVQAIERIDAEQIIILPNNSNVILAAQQAGEVVDIPVAVIPAKNIAQGMSALLSFNPQSSLSDNEDAMRKAAREVKSGEVTHSVRDTEIDGVHIEKGQYMGIADGQIKVTDDAAHAAAHRLLLNMADEETEIVTLIYGEGVAEEDAEALKERIESALEEVEVELHHGGQPLYPYLIAVE